MGLPAALSNAVFSAMLLWWLPAEVEVGEALQRINSDTNIHHRTKLTKPTDTIFVKSKTKSRALNQLTKANKP